MAEQLARGRTTAAESEPKPFQAAPIPLPIPLTPLARWRGAARPTGSRRSGGGASAQIGTAPRGVGSRCRE